MVIIWPCRLSVEEYAAAGRDVVVPRPCCPRCGVVPIFWSGYPRSVRAGVVFQIWVKRCRCKACRRNDSLLPSFCLAGRLDAVEVIGPPVRAVAQDAGTRSVARGIGELFAYTTVRGWWRRHRKRVGWLWSALAGLPWWGRPESVADGEIDALEAVTALATAAGAASVLVGLSLWPAVSLISGGMWLFATTDVPTTAGCGGSWMAVMASISPTIPP